MVIEDIAAIATGLGKLTSLWHWIYHITLLGHYIILDISATERGMRLHARAASARSTHRLAERHFAMLVSACVHYSRFARFGASTTSQTSSRHVADSSLGSRKEMPLPPGKPFQCDEQHFLQALFSVTVTISSCYMQIICKLHFHRCVMLM